MIKEMVLSNGGGGAFEPCRTTALPWQVDVSHVGCDKGLEKSKPGLIPRGYAIKD